MATLLQLRQLARLFADQRENEFISDAELNLLVNLKGKFVFDLLVQARGSEYYAAATTITLAPGVSRYDLPADFYQLNSVTIEWNLQEHEIMKPIQASRERARFSSNQAVWAKWDAKGYRLRGSQIEFLPVPNTEVEIRLQYVPRFTDLVADGDEHDFINGWEKLVCLGVAIEMMAIEKRSSSTLNALYEEELARIETMKTERDAEATHEVIDVEKVRTDPWYAPTFDDSFDPSFW